MAGHRVYTAIVTAVRDGRLREPFSKEAFKRACPGFGRGVNTGLEFDKNAGLNLTLFTVRLALLSGC